MIHKGGPLKNIFIFSLFFFVPGFLFSADPNILNQEEIKYLEDLARDTYHCIDFYVDAQTQLPLDNTKSVKDSYTSVTNIGLYMTSVAGAVELGLESRQEGLRKLKKLLANLSKLSSWKTFPYSWNHVTQLIPNKEKFVSTVDLGNYYAGIIVTRQYFPELQKQCDKLLKINWKHLYDPDRKFFYGGYNAKENISASWHYTHLGSESRLASFLGLAMSGLPLESWEALDRSLEKRYGMEYLKPGWQGGGLFLGFMSGLFLDEQGTLLGFSAGNFAKAQMAHKRRIDSAVWGWSSSDSPQYGYLGMNAIKDDIVTPYASALAVSVFPQEVVQNLKKLDELGVRPRQLVNGSYHDFGFRDAYDFKQNLVTPNYLILDQSMIFLALTNFLKDRIIVRLFQSYPPVQRALPMIKDYASRGAVEDENSFPISLSKRFRLSGVSYDAKRPEIYVTPKDPSVTLEAFPETEKFILSDENLESGNLSDSQDLQVQFSFLWDSQFLYLKTNVTDQSLQVAGSGSEIYKGDILEIYINSDGQGLDWGNPKDMQIGVTPPDEKGAHHTYAWFQNRKPTENELKTISKRTKDGYEIIAAISWEFLNIPETQKGQSLNCSIAIHDVDNDQDGDSKLNWYFRPKDGKINLSQLILR